MLEVTFTAWKKYTKYINFIKNHRKLYCIEDEESDSEIDDYIFDKFILNTC
jgi:hypothetical protein